MRGYIAKWSPPGFGLICRIGATSPDRYVFSVGDCEPDIADELDDEIALPENTEAPEGAIVVSFFSDVPAHAFGITHEAMARFAAGRSVETSRGLLSRPAPALPTRPTAAQKPARKKTAKKAALKPAKTTVGKKKPATKKSAAKKRSRKRGR